MIGFLKYVHFSCIIRDHVGYRNDNTKFYKAHFSSYPFCYVFLEHCIDTEDSTSPEKQ